MELKLTKNGPMHLSGKFKFIDSDGKEIITDKDLYLCRCGGSKNKPYCDGSHKTVGFIG
jgi:CDGSH-type Zn-finger protein